MPPVAVAAGPAPLACAPRRTNVLQHLFRDYFGRFAAEYDSRYAKELDNFRLERICRVATRFLTCGDYRQGVARIRCTNPECRHEYFRPFSCKGFFLCPSCSQKRILLFAEYLDEGLLLALPHRQFVFILPKALRVFLRHDQRLFAMLSRLIFSLIAEFYSAAAGKPITTAAVVAYQPFGDSLRFNPHFHALILEGGFDSGGQFYYLPISDTTSMAECLRRRSIALFLKLDLITQSFSETLLCWKHSGFSVDNSVRLDSGDHKARQALAQYIARAPLSLQKVSYDRPGGKVLYHTAYNPYFKHNTTLWNAADFIAALTQFIPPWGVRYVHYYGLYCSRCKALWESLPHVARVAPVGWKDSHGSQLPTEAAPPTIQTVPQRACRSAWARLIAKVYEVDPLTCPQCGTEMKLIAVVTDPAEVRKILRHLVKTGRAPPGLDPAFCSELS
jgi:hypothetical protein